MNFRKNSCQKEERDEENKNLVQNKRATRNVLIMLHVNRFILVELELQINPFWSVFEVSLR